MERRSLKSAGTVKLHLKLKRKHCCQGKLNSVHTGVKPASKSTGSAPASHPWHSLYRTGKPSGGRGSQCWFACQGTLISVLKTPLNIKDLEEYRSHMSAAPLWDLGSPVIGDKPQPICRDKPLQICLLWTKRPKEAIPAGVQNPGSGCVSHTTSGALAFSSQLHPQHCSAVRIHFYTIGSPCKYFTNGAITPDSLALFDRVVFFMFRFKFYVYSKY